MLHVACTLQKLTLALFAIAALTICVMAQVPVAQRQIITIAEARADANGDHILDRLDQTVTVSGQATVGSGLLSGDRLRVYIQDDSSGIELFNKKIGAAIQDGDYVIATGVVTLYFGRPQLKDVEYDVVSSKRRILTPINLKIAEAHSDKYVNMLVHVEGRVIHKGRLHGDYITINNPDEDAATIDVGITSSHQGNLSFNDYSVGDQLAVTGILERHEDPDSKQTNYRIVLRYPSDTKAVGFTRGSYRTGLIVGSIGLLGVLLWITLLQIQVKRRTRQLNEGKERYRLLFDSNPLPMWVLDQETLSFLAINDAAIHHYGYSRKEFLAMTSIDITAREDVGTLAETLTNASPMQKRVVECRHQTKDGVIINVEVRSQPLVFEGRPAELVLVNDITQKIWAAEEQARLQNERDQSLEQLQLQMEFMPIAFIIMDESFRTTYWNPAAERIFGFAKEEVLGKFSHLLMVPEESRGCVEDIFRRLEAGEVVSSVNDNVTKDGQLINCDWHAAPLRRADGTFVGIMAMAQDVTERKQAEATKAKLEAQLRQSQKMEAIGTLAGGIAHDFNNMLAAIIGYSELALMDLPEDSAANNRVTQVLKAGNRAKELVKQILTFSRQEEHERKPLRLQPIIDEALKLLRASLPSSIEIRRNIDPSVSSILGDQTQLHQVLMNLCTNAWHAMDEHGGVLELSLSTVEVDVDFAHTHSGLKQGPHVRLVVSDTGKGMDRPTVERIFEPFFTTKAPGSGTGLGLAVVHGIVKQLEGVISVYSEVGKGTTFNIYLPIHALEEALTLPASNVVPEGKGEHILFVDDEESLASLGKSMLERLGYRVTTEISSIEALKVFSAQPHDFDLVITDQTMPHMSGVEFAKVLLGIRPELPVILATGYSSAINPEKAQAIGIREFLFKPNTAQSLGEAIQRALSVSRKN